MRVGKQIKTVTSPKRATQKFNEKKQKSIPVSIPKKVPAEAVSWKFMNPWGYSIERPVFPYHTTACS